MSRWARLVLWTGLVLVILIAMPVPTLWKYPSWLAVAIFVESVMVLPAWLLMLPFVFLFDRMTMGRATLFVLSGSIAATLVALMCELFPKSHNVPTHDWILRRLEWVAVVSAAVCMVYVLIVRSTQTRISTNMQSTP